MTERRRVMTKDAVALVEAVYRCDGRRVDELLSSGTPVDARDTDGRTPLMHAVLATPPNLEIIRQLLHHGADPDVADKGQAWTSLHFAARDGKVEVVSALIAGGASVDPVDVFGNTPLWRATFMSSRTPSCVDCMEILLRAGANPDAANKSGNSPRDLAKDPGWERARMLLSQKA